MTRIQDASLSLYDTFVQLRNISFMCGVNQEVLRNSIKNHGFDETCVDTIESIVESDDGTWNRALDIIDHLNDDSASRKMLLHLFDLGALSVYQLCEMMDYILTLDTLQHSLIHDMIQKIINNVLIIQYKIETCLNVSRWKHVKVNYPNVVERLAVLKCEVLLRSVNDEIIELLLNGPKPKRGRPPKIHPLFIQPPCEYKTPSATRHTSTFTDPVPAPQQQVSCSSEPSEPQSEQPLQLVELSKTETVDDDNHDDHDKESKKRKQSTDECHLPLKRFKSENTSVENTKHLVNFEGKAFDMDQNGPKGLDMIETQNMKISEIRNLVSELAAISRADNILIQNRLHEISQKQNVLGYQMQRITLSQTVTNLSAYRPNFLVRNLPASLSLPLTISSHQYTSE